MGRDRRAIAVSERGRRAGVGGASDALGPGGRERARPEESGGVSGPSGGERCAGADALGPGGRERARAEESGGVSGPSAR